MNNLEKKIPDAATLIHTNHTTQINKIQKKKKNGDVDKKRLDTNGLVTTTVLNTKII